MAKYIDADLLRKEIERRRLSNRYIDTEGYEEELLEIIDSLQQEQPEVDLEKVVMIDNVIMNMTAEGYNNGYKTRPFYEGVLRRLNARKEEKK